MIEIEQGIDFPREHATYIVHYFIKEKLSEEIREAVIAFCLGWV